jgi:hypothetical protein
MGWDLYISVHSRGQGYGIYQKALVGGDVVARKVVESPNLDGEELHQ